MVLNVNGNSHFAKKFHASGIKVNYDVKWVTIGGHWTVEVYKCPPGAPIATNPHRAQVKIEQHKIILHANDISLREACTTGTPPVCPGNKDFSTSAHEYGHSQTKRLATESYYTANQDEYNPSSPHILDTNSIMNIGNQLRERHISATIDALNELMKNESVTFTVRSIK